jgi:hypothetical protein
MVWSFFDIKQFENVNNLIIKNQCIEAHLQLKKGTNYFNFISVPIGPNLRSL